MQSRMLAPACDEDPCGRLDVRRGDAVSVPAQPSVAHVSPALVEVVDTVPPGMSRRRVLEPTGAREHVRGPDVIPTATAKGAREGARVGIMSVGCPRTAGRATKSGQAPNPVDVS